MCFISSLYRRVVAYLKKLVTLRRTPRKDIWIKIDKKLDIQSEQLRSLINGHADLQRSINKLSFSISMIGKKHADQAGDNEDDHGVSRYEHVPQSPTLVKTNKPGITPISDLELSVRVQNCMDELGITTVEELTRYRERDLLKLKNFGKKSLKEVKGVLEEKGLSLSKTIRTINKALRDLIIAKRIVGGESYQDVAERYGISKDRVRQILIEVCRRSWGITFKDLEKIRNVYRERLLKLSSLQD